MGCMRMDSRVFISYRAGINKYDHLYIIVVLLFSPRGDVFKSVLPVCSVCRKPLVSISTGTTDERSYNKLNKT
jgi:Iap family predicted aminopeptidase